MNNDGDVSALRTINDASGTALRIGQRVVWARPGPARVAGRVVGVGCGCGATLKVRIRDWRGRSVNAYVHARDLDGI